MSLKDAQNKLSTDISTLYETYQMISKNKQYFNDLDVALLQQHLLHIYHSLLKVQSQLGTLPQAEDLVLSVVANEPVIKEEEPEQELPTDLFSSNNFAETKKEPSMPEPESKPVQREIKTPEPVQLKATPAPVIEEEPVKEPEPVKMPETVIEEEITPEPEPVAETPEPTLDDLEKLMREQEEKESAMEPFLVDTPKPLTQPETKSETKEESALSLLDKLTANMRTSDVYEKIAREQISLKQAINLNKKIAFVNNLFNENTVEYAKAIERLNSASGLHEALRHFSELKHQYNWNNENQLVKDLEQLIEKRYS